MSAKTQRSEGSVKANAGASRRYAESKIKYTTIRGRTRIDFRVAETFGPGPIHSSLAEAVT